MKVKYDTEVVDYIANVGRYYGTSDAETARHSKLDIQATIRRISSHTLVYALIGRGSIRRAVTRRYGYLIYFRFLDETVIAVLSIRHGAERPRFPAEG